MPPMIHDELDRRAFMKLMGASFALAGTSACTRMPLEKIFPYIEQPVEATPGKPLFYASAMSLGGYAKGILVESHLGKPTKIEGNPDHPDSHGTTDVFMQASILELYDPERSKVVRRGGEISNWDEFLAQTQAFAQAWRETHGRGVRVLTESITSPTLAWMIGKLISRYPEIRWHSYEPIHRDNIREGARLSYGHELEPIYRLDRAKVIVSLDLDFLSPGPGHLRYSREFIDGRRVRAGHTEMNRLYVAECTPGLSGAMADHRVAIRAADISPLVRILGRRLGVLFSSMSDVEKAIAAKHTEWLTAVISDLEKYRGQSLVLIGESHPAPLHVLVNAINSHLANANQTIEWIPTVVAGPERQMSSVSDLTRDLESDAVNTVLMIGGDPVYNTPGDLGFAKALSRVENKIHLGLYEDETSAACGWHLPSAHFLETWGDARAFDGTATIQQPLCAPFYENKSELEVLALLMGEPGQSAHEIVQNYWKGSIKADFESFWRKSLHDGVVTGSAFSPQKVSFHGNSTENTPEITSSDLEITFRPDPSVWDGRFANNAWLQELPRPLSQLTWDNVAAISPPMAKKYHLKTGDVLELTVGDVHEDAPAYIFPGQPDDSISVTFGYGQKGLGHIARRGFNAYALQKTQGFSGRVQIKKTGKTYGLTTTQHQQTAQGRSVARHGTRDEFLQKPKSIAPRPSEPIESLLPDYPYPEYAWAMAIDLGACIGCNVCMIACQAENNIPVVGKGEVARTHSMHWIRVDRYYEGPGESPRVIFQPVPCMHCETAPCEEVCPTEATNHSSDGLNQMIYNRCVGTRFCSNNCPYKVRRFNFFQYSDMKIRGRILANPDVTIRSRGVMEKCTYCVQRIKAAQIEADKETRRVRDGEITPACAQACPTEAIVFGDKNDPTARVTKLRKEPLNYGMLEELGTKPRTTYLARVTNPVFRKGGA